MAGVGDPGLDVSRSNGIGRGFHRHGFELAGLAEPAAKLERVGDDVHVNEMDPRTGTNRLSSDPLSEHAGAGDGQRALGPSRKAGRVLLDAAVATTLLNQR